MVSQPPLLARQLFSFSGTLLSLPTKGSLDIHSFSDDWYMIAIPRKSVLRDQGTREHDIPGAKREKGPLCSPSLIMWTDLRRLACPGLAGCSPRSLQEPGEVCVSTLPVWPGNGVALVLKGRGSQPSWHQGQVLWKTVLSWTSGGGRESSSSNGSNGELQMKRHSNACRSSPAAQPGS